MVRLAEWVLNLIPFITGGAGLGAWFRLWASYEWGSLWVGVAGGCCYTMLAAVLGFQVQLKMADMLKDKHDDA